MKDQPQMDRDFEKPIAGRSGIRREFWIGCVLLLVTVLVYWPARNCAFFCIDDDLYVSRNPEVLPGVTFEGIRWALTTGHAGNWHPVTWISHMLDCQLYGTKPAGYHLTNVFFHAANVLLLFAILRFTTGTVWRSALVAALFAWHPMHVESVAWVAERKDVLSTFLGLLSLFAYTHYALSSKAQGPKPWRFYAVSLVLFALALMSKAMLVTLPFLFLLLDYWPLGRTDEGRGERGEGREERGGGGGMCWPKIVLEKLPFLALAVIASTITFMVQKRFGAVTPLAMLPLSERLANVPIAYLAYIGKLFWPHPLCVLYPFLNPRNPDLAMASAMVLLVLSVAAVLWSRGRPYLPVGWLWFVGTLVPVIGLVQVGAQTMADRYTYLPYVGLFIVLAWGMAELAARLPAARFVLIPAAGAGLLACLICTHYQLQYWKDSLTLCEHALAVGGNNPVVLSSEGAALMGAGRYEEGVRRAQQALDMRPGIPFVEAELAYGLEQLGKIDEAVRHYRAALDKDPNLPEPLNSLSWILATGSGGNRPTNTTEAIDLANRACAIGGNKNPRFTETLAAAYADAGRFDEAVANIIRAGKLAAAAGDHAQVKKDETLLALFRAHRAWHLHPSPADLACDAARQAQAEGDSREAIARYREALRLDPDHVESLNNLAWILATDPDPHSRDGAEASRLATRACELTGYQQPFLIGTLAAAYAEAGRYDQAVAAGNKARKLFLEADMKDYAETNRILLLQYAAHQPHHEKGVTTNAHE
jgi:Flp pilus assembly protein TadD